MNTLWAPWRMQYILGKKERGCIFCREPRKEANRGSLVVYEARHAFVMMNKFPYNNGHLIVAPKRHCPDLAGLGPREFGELFELVRTSVQVLKKSLGAHGFNVGINLGKVAGAGVVNHVHLHIVPRWRGDTNFMPIIGETKVIPEYLEKTCERLHSDFLQFTRRKGTRKGGRKR